jgi:hypothetical protein
MGIFPRLGGSASIAVLVTLLAIVGVMAGLFIPKNFLEAHNLSQETMALLLGILILIFGDRVIDVFRHRENTRAIQELIDPVQRAIDCRYMGRYAEALEYLKTRLPYAHAIKDTAVVHGISHEELPLQFYQYDAALRMSEAIAKFVCDGHTWRGIVSNNITDTLVKEAYVRILPIRLSQVRGR